MAKTVHFLQRTIGYTLRASISSIETSRYSCKNNKKICNYGNNLIKRRAKLCVLVMCVEYMFKNVQYWNTFTNCQMCYLRIKNRKNKEEIFYE